MPLSKPFYAAAIYDETRRSMSRPKKTNDEMLNGQSEVLRELKTPKLVKSAEDDATPEEVTCPEVENVNVVVEEVEPAEEDKVEEEVKAEEEVKVEEDVKAEEEVKVVEEVKTVEELKVTDDVELTEEVKPTEEVKVLEEVQSPGELNAIEELLCTVEVELPGDPNIKPDETQPTQAAKSLEKIAQSVDEVKGEIDEFLDPTEAEATKFPKNPIPSDFSLLQLSSEVALKIEEDSYHSAMDLLDKIISEYNLPTTTTDAVAQNPENVDTSKNVEIAVAINESTSILDLNPKDLIALNRRALAHLEFGYLDEAFEDATAISFLENFAQGPTTLFGKDLLDIMAKNEVDALEVQKSESSPTLSGRVCYDVPSFLRTFLSDPVTQIWSLGKESGRDGQELLDYIFPYHCKIESDQGIETSGYKLAVEHLVVGKYDDLVALLTAELLDPNSKHIPATYLMRGTIRHLIGCAEDALKDYDFVISHLDSSNDQVSAAWIKKGLCLSERIGGDKIQESIRCFAKSKLLIQNNPDRYFAEAQVTLLRTDNPSGALTYIEKACELAPTAELFRRWKIYIRLRIASKRHCDEGIEAALLEFQPPLGSSNQPEILRVDICILAWIGHFAEAHTKLDTLFHLEPEDPRIYIGKLLLHEVMYGEPKQAFDLLQDVLLNYGRCAQIHQLVGKFAFKVGLLEAAAECFGKALTMSETRPDMEYLVKAEKLAATIARVIAKHGYLLKNYADLPAFQEHVKLFLEI